METADREQKEELGAAAEMRLVLDAIPVAVAHCDASQRYVFANQVYAARFGLTPEQVVGRSTAEILGEKLCAQIAPYTERVLAGESLQYEADAEYSAVGRCHVHCSCTPVRDAAGRVTGWVATVTDITEHHRTEQELHDLKEAERALERYRLLAENARDIVLFIRPDGRILEANTAALAAYGYKREELLRATIFDLRDPASGPFTPDQMAEADRHGITFETVHRRRDGSLFPVEVSSRGTDVAGERLLLSIVRDISERRRAEEALREADRRKDEFLATLAHELRNPLAPIRNAVQVLRLQGEPNGEAQRVRDIIDRQVQQLTRLVDDLLDVSRITRGTIELRREPAEVAAVVERALETSRPLLDAASHRLSVTFPAEPLWVMADVTRLAQILSNLLNNAAKFTRPGGHIELSVERDGGDAVIRVRDDGIGIPPQMLSRIFDLFAQVDTSLERAQGGLGLGLTIARRLVEMHGGTITAASDGPGTGTELTVRLPPLQSPEESAAAGADRQQAGEAGLAAELKVLVVDDNNDSADSLAMWLELAGHEVRTAYDGPQALAAAAELRPQVILLDIGMPGMSGYDVARRLRQHPATRDVLLLAMTGWGQDEDRRLSREAGFDEHLVKPLDPQLLKDLLARLAARRTERRDIMPR
jgi:two-component system CheB/CheR fusion protein